MSDRPAEAGFFVLVGVGLTSAALMATEIALTRVLSVTVWYHFAFFAICVALLGTGLGALLVHAAQRGLSRERAPSACAGFLLAQAASTLLVGLALVRVTPDWFGGMAGTFTLFTWKLGLVFGLTMLPFLMGGLVLALAASRHSSAVHRVYFADLCGAAVGCILAIPILSWLGGARALIGAAVLATLAAAAFAIADAPVLHGRARRRLAILGTLVGLAQLACGVSPWLDVRSAKGIDITLMKPELMAWNSFSLVSLFGMPPAHGWGLSTRYKGPLPEQKSIVIDMSALTPVARFDGDFDKVRYVQADLSSLVYRVVPPPQAACVIGAGGGKDVLSALVAKSKHVTGVEINPLIVEQVMHGVAREFSGRLYERPDVDIITGDGRTFLRRTQRRFDVILISMVDTSAATAAGAYALTENGLYTREAFIEFLARLRPGGVLTVSTVSLPGLAVGARLAALARDAVLAHGGDPARSIAVAHTPWIMRKDSELYDILIKPDGFTEAELGRYTTALSELDFRPGYVPGRKLFSGLDEDRLITRILSATDSRALAAEMETWSIDVTSVNDDRPFFFYQNRFSDFLAALGPAETTHLFGNGLRVLAKVLVIAALMLLFTSIVPLLWVRRSLGAARGLSIDLAYVACLGLGFMCVEIALVHRVTIYLGQPTYTLVAVLCVLLLAGGIGSRWLGLRLLGNTRAAAFLFGGIVVATLALPQLVDVVFGATQGASLPVRALVVAALLAPLGLLLGVPLPAGLGLVARRDPSRVAWLWGVNGSASVLGSIVATLISLHAGTQIALFVGAAFYAGAAFVWSRLAREATIGA